MNKHKYITARALELIFVGSLLILGAKLLLEATRPKHCGKGVAGRIEGSEASR